MECRAAPDRGLIDGWIGPACIGLAMAALGGCGSAPEPEDDRPGAEGPNSNQVAYSPGDMQAGLDIYREQGCGMCHGDTPFRKPLAGLDLAAEKIGGVYIEEFGENEALGRMMDYIRNAADREAVVSREQSFPAPMQNLPGINGRDLELLAQLMLSYR